MDDERRELGKRLNAFADVPELDGRTDDPALVLTGQFLVFLSLPSVRRIWN